MKNPIIERFEKAVREHEFAGAVSPEDRPLIEAEYKDAKRELEKLLERKR